MIANLYHRRKILLRLLRADTFILLTNDPDEPGGLPSYLDTNVVEPEDMIESMAVQAEQLYQAERVVNALTNELEIKRSNPTTQRLR